MVTLSTSTILTFKNILGGISMNTKLDVVVKMNELQAELIRRYQEELKQLKADMKKQDQSYTDSELTRVGAICCELVNSKRI